MSDNKKPETMRDDSSRTEALNRQLPPTQTTTPMPKVKPVKQEKPGDNQN